MKLVVLNEDIEYEKKYLSNINPNGSGEIEYVEIEQPKNPKDWHLGSRNRKVLDKKEWQRRAFGIREGLEDYLMPQADKDAKELKKLSKSLKSLKKAFASLGYGYDEYTQTYDKDLGNGIVISFNAEYPGRLEYAVYNENERTATPSNIIVLYKSKNERLHRERMRKIDEKLNKNRTPRALKESFDDMKVFMNTWANYNENGADDGITPTGWMSIDDAIDYCKKYAEQEPFINDTENIPFDVNEYSNAVKVLADLKELEDSNVDEEVLKAIMDATGDDLKAALERYEDGDYMYLSGVFNYSDLGHEVIESIGSIHDALGENASSYIDYEMLSRDLSYDMREIMRDRAEEEVEHEHRFDDDDEYDKEAEIEDWIDAHIDDYIDSYIDDMEADGSIDLETYFDYEKFGRDLTYEGWTFTDNGAIEIY